MDRSESSASCREAALKLLERTRRTRRDLERRLKEKDFDGATIAATLDRLTEVGLVDDVEFARAWLAGRWGRKPSGWRRLEQELRAKGVSQEDAERARAQLEDRGAAPDEVASAGMGWPADNRHADRPRGHRCTGNTGATPEPLDGTYRLGPVLGPGGDVHASIADLARYASFQLDGCEGRATRPALKPETWRRLHDDPDGAPNGYAMGWEVMPSDSGRPMLFHDGTAGTFYTRILIEPSRDLAVVIAANAGEPCGKAACEQGLTAVLARVERGRKTP